MGHVYTITLHSKKNFNSTKENLILENTLKNGIVMNYFVQENAIKISFLSCTTIIHNS
jgi:hypothetical protein